jgi:hypothetical protein
VLLHFTSTVFEFLQLDREEWVRYQKDDLWPICIVASDSLPGCLRMMCVAGDESFGRPGAFIAEGL